ncbi:MAG: SDR family NAD(P)-dependent oxidoreductase, partial [Bacteroidota bacterium]|nr:SDR family NAD(P)-dependent oxidoreductase [Bacteroidota bacterium]
MKNLIVFITGASSGIGFSTAEFLVENGYTVIGTSRNPDKYSNYKFPLIYMDLTNENSISKAVKLVYDKYKSIDVLINNAGVSMAAPAEETDLDMLNELMKTNFYGPINVIKHVLKIMRLKNSGKIINISSIAGDNGLPFRSIYSASKAAINRFSESLR